MKKLILKYRLYLIGAILGAIGGYLYWRFVGCSSGSCAITSKPMNSTIYGAVMGSLILSLFEKSQNKKTSL